MNRRRLFREMITIIGVTLVNAVACAGPEGAPPEIENLTRQLTSEDAKVAEEARAKLEAMGAEVVPALFEKLPAADWTLRPRLLEVLSAHGREFAKEKLLKGNETEKIYAALVYKLSLVGEPDNSSTIEYKAMVDWLLNGMKNDDKYLRAAASYAMLQGDQPAVVFDHLQDAVPAFISSFDSPIVLLVHAQGPQISVTWVIGTALDTLIGDRLAYFEVESRFRRVTDAQSVSPQAKQEYIERLLAANQDGLDELRSEWNAWWRGHANLTPVALGRQMIERNLRIFAQADDARRLAHRRAEKSLQVWTGNEELEGLEQWSSWWGSSQKTYAGPPYGRTKSD